MIVKYYIYITFTEHNTRTHTHNKKLHYQHWTVQCHNKIIIITHVTGVNFESFSIIMYTQSRKHYKTIHNTKIKEITQSRSVMQVYIYVCRQSRFSEGSEDLFVYIRGSKLKYHRTYELVILKIRKKTVISELSFFWVSVLVVQCGTVWAGPTACVLVRGRNGL